MSLCLVDSCVLAKNRNTSWCYQTAWPTARWLDPAWWVGLIMVTIGDRHGVCPDWPFIEKCIQLFSVTDMMSFLTLISESVHNFVPEWNISTSIEWIAKQFCTDVNVPQGMNPDDFGDPLAIRGWNLWLWAKCLYNYWMGYHGKRHSCPPQDNNFG